MNRFLASSCLALFLAAVPSFTGGLEPLASSGGETQRDSASAGGARHWIAVGDKLMQQTREGSPGDRFEQARQAYDRALGLQPENIDALVGLAWVANSQHRFAEGIRWARRALQADPGEARALALLSDAAVEIGDYEQALEFCQQALDLRPNLSTYSRAAQVVWLTGNSMKAQWLMRRAIAAGAPRPENIAWCRAQLAHMLFESGMLLPAEEEARQAVELAPRNAHVLAVVGRLTLARRDYPAASAFFERSIAVQPTHEALSGLVDALALAGRKEDSERQAAALIAFHTNSLPGSAESAAHPHAHGPGNAQLAGFYADHDRDLDLALREALAAREAAPNAHTLTTLAWCQYKKGLLKEADKTIRKVLKIGTPEAAIYFRAGMIQSGLGRKAQAQKLLSQALSLNPHFHPRDADLAAATLAKLGETSPKSY